MKTITKLGLAVMLFMATTVFISAKAQEKTIYGYSYSTPVTKYYEIKKMYLSNIVTGVIDSKDYYDSTPTVLSNQWQDAVQAEDNEDYFKYSATVHGFSKYDDDKEAVEKHRTELIRDFKQRGYTVVVLHHFKFLKNKK